MNILTKMSMQNILFKQLWVPLVFSTLIFPSAAFATVQKCQDASGKWHYGDHAAEECSNAKISELNESGVMVREEDVPPSEEELQAEREAAKRKQEEENAAIARRKLEDRLLATYDSEQSLIDARDQRVNAINAQIEVNNNFLSRFALEEEKLQEYMEDATISAADKEQHTQSLESLAKQIKDYENANAQHLKDQQIITQRFNLLLKEYQAILKRRGIN